MFTGIIETVGRVDKIGKNGDYRVLTIEPSQVLQNMTIGESIAVDGCCLTVTKVGRKGIDAEVSPESIRATIIGEYKSGDMVNLERAMRAEGRFGGHFVSGHVDSTGRIDSISKKGNILEMKIAYEQRFSGLVIEKGSIAINGISLTINSCDDESMNVNLIPQTRKETTVDGWKKGMKVNLEFDMLGKYILKRIAKESQEGVTMAKLIKHGWTA